MAQETRYESTFLINGNLQDDAAEDIIRKVEDVLTRNGATLIETERWGRRKLAYDIENMTSAFYISAHFTAPGAAIAKLERVYQLDENIVRWLTLVMPETSHRSRAAMKKRIEDVVARRAMEAQNAELAEREAEANAANAKRAARVDEVEEA
jgi:small subunit ribosomal protein S6